MMMLGDVMKIFFIAFAAFAFVAARAAVCVLMMCEVKKCVVIIGGGFVGM